MGKIIKLQAPNHFGDCPKCKKNDGHLNIGRDHWFHCKKHRVKWWVGNNIFPDWMEETSKIWKRNATLLDHYIEIEPFQKWKFSIDENAFSLSSYQKKLEAVIKLDS